MPELPEVETVRAGLADRVVGRRIAAVEVCHPRAVRRHGAGPEDFAAVLAGRTVDGAYRRGKYLWLPLDTPAALVGHLGMSGQLLTPAPDAPEATHLRVRFRFADSGPPLWFVDQRTFGGWSVSRYDRVAAVPEGCDRAAAVPEALAHVAPDPLEPSFDDEAFVAAVRRRRSPVKAVLLDQRLVSGVGNIYADEALWRARVHGARRADRLTRPVLRRLLGHVRDVLAEAVAAGGTSFDALYVDMDGAPGWFAPALDVYGREGLPCRRCQAPLRREPFTNRSSYSCPRCQPRPRAAARPRTASAAPRRTGSRPAGR